MSDGPSPWLRRWAHLLPVGARVLDVAAGGGRHAVWLAARGHAVTAIDRDVDALAALADADAAAQDAAAQSARPRVAVECIVADLETAPWPLDARRFDAVVVFNYLWRPLFPALHEALAPGGVLIAETFAAGNETVGRPRRNDFLLGRGELLGLAAGLRIVAYEDGFLDLPARFVQRLVAVGETAASRPDRYPLDPPGDGSASLESPRFPHPP